MFGSVNYHLARATFKRNSWVLKMSVAFSFLPQGAYPISLQLTNVAGWLVLLPQISEGLLTGLELVALFTYFVYLKYRKWEARGE